MRRCIVAALIAAMLVAALPVVVGSLLQYRYQRLLEAIAGQGYSILASDYRLGWFRSTATAEIAPPVAGVSAVDPSRLRLQLALGHGPQVWLREWPPTLALARGRARVAGVPLPPLVLAARLMVSGARAVEVHAPDLTYSGAAGQLQTLGGHAVITMLPNGHWRAGGGLGAVEATAPDGRRLQVADLRWHLRADVPGALLQASTVELSLAALRLDAVHGQTPVELADLALGLSAEFEAATVAVAARGDIDVLRVGPGAYAPSRLALVASGLDAAALRTRLLDFGRAALTPSQGGLTSGQPWLVALADLLVGTPSVQLDHATLTTPYGEMRAAAALRLGPVGQPAAADISARGSASSVGSTPGIPEVLTALGRRLDGRASLSAPQALVVAWLARQQAARVRRELMLRGESADPLSPALAADLEAAAQAAAAKLLREGWLVPSAGRLTADLRLDAAGLTVNDKPVALPGWLKRPDAELAADAAHGRRRP